MGYLQKSKIRLNFNFYKSSDIDNKIINNILWEEEQGLIELTIVEEFGQLIYYVSWLNLLSIVYIYINIYIYLLIKEVNVVNE